eukprot:COSAG06_NODE_34206_length_478_cov_0.683377_2_plen_80_part_01
MAVKQRSGSRTVGVVARGASHRVGNRARDDFHDGRPCSVQLPAQRETERAVGDERHLQAAVFQNLHPALFRFRRCGQRQL